ncbi:hypothetical protein V2J09_010559 [Rumex salicifolius]
MRGRRSGGELPDFRGGDRNRKREKIGMGRRRSLLIGLFLALAFGVTVYFRLWIIDYKISSDDAELIRRQFDIAHKEAVDESAEWRYRFDEERDKATKCMRELDEIKGSGEKNSENVDTNNRLELLQKDNTDLLQRLETLKQELETLKLKCSSR